MMDYFSAFFLIGSFILFKLAWEDAKNRLIDERLSSFMVGIVSFLFLIMGRFFEFFVFALFIGFVLGWLKDKKYLSGLGSGDLSVLTWVVSGTWFFSWHLTTYLMILYILFFIIFRYFIFKKEGFPVVFVIAFSFITLWSLSILYL